MPKEVATAFDHEGLRAAYDTRPPYQRNDYLGWTSRAVREQTWLRRLDQMLGGLRAGSGYMGMPWSPSRTRRESTGGTPPGPDAL